MPRFEIDLPEKAVERLQTVVTRHNEDLGTSISVQEWLTAHALDIAVGDELAAAYQQLERQNQADLQAAVRATRQRLIDDLSDQTEEE